MAVRANRALTTGSGRTVTAAGAARMIPPPAWHRMRTGTPGYLRLPRPAAPVTLGLCGEP
jgi:hypothetical protein